ncbi:MAG: type II toxin-antitoxin system RelE/ParE family toxin [Pseudonocardiaceae bacterium]
MIHPEVREWLHEIRKTDRLMTALIGQAIQHVIDSRGPDEGRPLVDRIKGSRLHHLKELRPASTGETEVRILFIFDPARQNGFVGGRRQVQKLARLVRGGNPACGGPLHRAPGCAE